MDSSKITRDFALSCLRKLKSILNHTKKKYELVGNVEAEDCASLYDLAKEHETKTRNLKKAFIFYINAAISGEKVNSCIKDIASVLHQAGLTEEAIKFMEEMKSTYKGDMTKYNKLKQNLQSQIEPTGKHEYKNILIDLVDIKLKDPVPDTLNMFGNSSRIKGVRCYSSLGFAQKCQEGRYIVLEFDSFSAAKKTMDTFKADQWFGINKFWLDVDHYIVAECDDPKTDFDRGFLLSHGRIQKVDGGNHVQWSTTVHIPDFQQIYGFEGLELTNERSRFLIQNFSILVRPSTTL